MVSELGFNMSKLVRNLESDIVVLQDSGEIFRTMLLYQKKLTFRHS
jgi:hypothetical protein